MLIVERSVYIEEVGYVCGHGNEGDRCAEKLAQQPSTDDTCIRSEALRSAGLGRRVRSQISEHALLAVLGAKRCVERAKLSSAELSELALFLGVPSGSEVGLPFVEAVRLGLRDHPALSRADVFNARSVHVLELLRLSTGNTAGHIASNLGLHGPNACYIGGRSTFYALLRAYAAIRTGSLARALVVGGESQARSADAVAPRAGCAILLTAHPGTGRIELDLSLSRSSRLALVAPFTHFESLNTLLNLMVLLESKLERESTYVQESDPSGHTDIYGILGPLGMPKVRKDSAPSARSPVRAASSPRRVVITAAGVVSPLAIGLGNFAEALFAGRSAATRLSDAFGSKWEGLPINIGAPVLDFVPRVMEGAPTAELERSARFAIEAVGQIVDQVGPKLLHELRAPLYCGVGAAQPLLDFDEALRLCEGTDARARRTATACELSSHVLRDGFGLTGRAQTFAGACSASTQACIQAAEEIRAGLEVAVIAGGHDSLLSIPGLYMMHELGTLATHEADPARAVRPFDLEREGTMVGEGAVYFLFEELEHARARGALILAEVSGWGSSLDGHHITSPDPEGTYGVAMIQAALAMAGIEPECVDYVNAHGTATLLNDATEARILRRAFGTHRPWVSSSKPQVGHLIGACGAVELAACAAALVGQRLPPNLNLTRPDPECDLKLVTTAEHASLDCVLSLSFGFGGQNSCLLLRRYEEAR